MYFTLALAVSQAAQPAVLAFLWSCPVWKAVEYSPHNSPSAHRWSCLCVGIAFWSLLLSLAVHPSWLECVWPACSIQMVSEVKEVWPGKCGGKFLSNHKKYWKKIEGLWTLLVNERIYELKNCWQIDTGTEVIGTMTSWNWRPKWTLQ